MSGRAKPAGHAECAVYLRDRAAALGVEVTVSTATPLILTPYTTAPFTCPHGTTYYIEPTSEQIAQWARDGVA